MSALQTVPTDAPAGPTYQAPGVLVVDDADVRRFVRVALTRVGYQVFDAPSLDDAVRLSGRSAARSGLTCWTCPCRGPAAPRCCASCAASAPASRRCS